MPNHVKNILKIKTNNPKALRDRLTSISNSHHEILPNETECIIDFDKIIPEPRKIEDCPKDCLMTKDSHSEVLEDRPWFDWYVFHNKYWDTKWNAYDGSTKIKDGYITFIFNTAWNTPMLIFEKLAEVLHMDMEIWYADEDLGNNCGWMEYDAEDDAWYHNDIGDTEKFANDVWNEEVE